MVKSYTTILVEPDVRDRLIELKQKYFNTDAVSYSSVLKKILEQVESNA